MTGRGHKCAIVARPDMGGSAHPILSDSPMRATRMPGMLLTIEVVDESVAFSHHHHIYEAEGLAQMQ